MISVRGVSKNFGPRKALDQISFEIKQGEILGLLGPNGAGKTTLMRILTGFFPPTEGKVLLDGNDLSKSPKELKKKIGYLPERISLYPDLRVEEFLKFVAEIKGVRRSEAKREIEEKLGQCGIESVRKRLIGQLSKGFVQRVGLAQALIANPEVLIFDEPTSGLDPKQIIEIRELIRALGRKRTLVLSTHILPEVSRVCERILILNQGKIVAQGSPDELEQGLRDREEIMVRVGKGAGNLDRVLTSIAGVLSVTKLDEEDAAVNYLLQTVPREDLRSEISRRIVEAGFPLLEITTRRLSLEDVFLKLTLQEVT